MVTPAVRTRRTGPALFYVGVRGHEYQGVRIIGGQCGVQLSKLLTQWVIIALSMSLRLFHSLFVKLQEGP